MSRTIRDRRPRDLSALAAALVRVHALDGYPVEGVADPVGWLHHPHALANWAAIVDDNAIGQVTLADANPDDDVTRIWVEQTGGQAVDLAIVVRLFVDPEHRTVGAGRLLMAAALEHARELGRTVALDVMAKDHDAIRLYERLGAHRIGQVSHLHGAGHAEPALVFGWPRRS